jgi:hypothetical protein
MLARTKAWSAFGASISIENALTRDTAATKMKHEAEGEWHRHARLD